MVVQRNLFLLSLATVYVTWLSAQLRVADGAVFVSSRHGRHRNINRDVISAAQAMNSVAFLSELVKLKDTSDVRYYVGGAQTPPPDSNKTPSKSAAAHFLRRIRGEFSSLGDRLQPASKPNSNARSRRSTCCTEYTGHLWFLRNRGIRFMETLRISKISKDGSCATIECITKYRQGGRWVDCSKVTCRLLAVERGIDIVADSIVLVRLPLAGKAVRSKIASSFESAVSAFFS